MGLFDRFRRKASISEDAAWGTSGAPSRGLLGALMSGRADSGVAVNPVTAMQATAVWACVQALSQDVAKIPPTLKRWNDPRDPDKGSKIVTKHPVAHLIRKPNNWQTWFEYSQFRELSKLLYGNAYSYKSYDGRGELTQLIPIRPDRVTILEAPGGELFYRISPGTTFEIGQLRSAGMDELIVPSEYIHHVRNMSLDTVYGLSPVQMFREAVGLSLATEKHAAKSFGNGTRLSGVLRHPAKISDEAASRLKASWQAAYSGLDNAFKTALLEEDMSFEQLSMNHEDAQLIESRQFQITDIARIYRVPPHKIGDLSRATFTNIEQQSLDYYNDALMPHFEMVEARMGLDFLTQNERDKGFYLEHDVSRLLRGDAQARSEFYSKMAERGVFSINEIRAKEGMNPVEHGDARYRPLNMIEVGAPDPNQQPEPSPAEPEEPTDDRDDRNEA